MGDAEIRALFDKYIEWWRRRPEMFDEDDAHTDGHLQWERESPGPYLVEWNTKWTGDDYILTINAGYPGIEARSDGKVSVYIADDEDDVGLNAVQAKAASGALLDAIKLAAMMREDQRDPVEEWFSRLDRLLEDDPEGLTIHYEDWAIVAFDAGITADELRKDAESRGWKMTAQGGLVATWEKS